MPMFLRGKKPPYHRMSLWHRVGFAMTVGAIASVAIPVGLVLNSPALFTSGLALWMWVAVGT